MGCYCFRCATNNIDLHAFNVHLDQGAARECQIINAYLRDRLPLGLIQQ